MRRALLAFVVLVSLPRAVWAQGNPLGPEFRVNTYTTGAQGQAEVASDPSGNFVVAFTSAQDAGTYGIFGQRYAASGAPLGPDFRVNTYTTGTQGFPTVATDALGNFVVVWASAQDPSYGLFGQRFASTGVPLGPEFRVNTYTTGPQYLSSVASDGAGNFLVAWESDHDGSSYGIFGQRFASSGAPLGPEFRVNTFTTGGQYRPSVATAASGGFVVVWVSPDGFGSGIFGQRYANTGVPLGPEFRVNTFTTNSQQSPDVTSDSAGNFVVVWDSYPQDGSSTGIIGQRYASSGAPLGSEFRVNTYTTGDQELPSVAADASGNFVVAWASVGQDGSADGLFGQRYAGSGAPLGPEFRVNSFTTGPQYDAFVAADATGDFVVIWESDLQDGSDIGVFGQRYSMIVPVELMRFGVE